MRGATTRARVERLGRGRSKGGDREAGGKIIPEKPRECRAMTGAARPLEWPTSPPEWGTRRGAVRSLEWRKTYGGPATELVGESSRHRAPTLPEWQSCPGETKPLEGPQKSRADQERTDGGGEGTQTPPPPNQPGRREPTA